jgi:hypothetical protein
MATINGIPMAAARIRGELCNATDYARAEMAAWVLEDGVGGAWMDRARPATIRLYLMHGYGGESHLFDRAAARVADAVEGRIYPSVAAAKRAAEGVRCRESLRYSVEVEAGNYHRDVPAELEPQAEAIRARIAGRDAARRRRERAKFVAGLGVYRGEDGAYRVTTAAAARRGRWVDAGGDRYWYCEGLDDRSGPSYVGVSGPNRGYASEAEAAAALAAVRAHYA